MWYCVCVRAREELALTQKACQDLSENVQRVLLEKESGDLRSSAEIDDLYRTKRNLEERLIELIRYSCLPQKQDLVQMFIILNRSTNVLMCGSLAPPAGRKTYCGRNRTLWSSSRS